MVIAVNTRFLLKDQLEGCGYFLSEIFKRITLAYPEHKFIFIFDREFDPQFIYSSNIIPVVTGPAARHPLLWKLWYDLKVPAVLKKYKADVFVSADGFCSLQTKVPQCLVVHDLAFLHFPGLIKRSQSWYYKRFTPKFLEKAKTVVTVSEFSKADILQHYKIDPEKIDVIYNGVHKNFLPLSFEDKQKVKQEFTEGCEYFIYTGSIHPRKNLLNLLKAFSLFKKRQQTNMKLVLVGRLAWKYEKFVQDLKSYKYRNDVVMTGYADESVLTKLTASAYGMVYPSLFEGFGLPVVEAMQTGVPVITSQQSAMEEIANGSALLADPEDPRSIAEQMMRLYKDEKLRNELIQKGFEKVVRYNWDKTAKLFWEVILKTVK